MSALSQTLSFTPTHTPITTSTTAVVYPNTATQTLSFVSGKLKGDGYFSGSDGFHSVQYTANSDFYGTITMQATLASNPVEADWFNVSNTSVTYTPLNVRNTSTVDLFNFVGNFVWVRGQVYINDGAVMNILYNH
jgi:hypothetical protein